MLVDEKLRGRTEGKYFLGGKKGESETAPPFENDRENKTEVERQWR